MRADRTIEIAEQIVTTLASAITSSVVSKASIRAEKVPTLDLAGDVMRTNQPSLDTFPWREA